MQPRTGNLPDEDLILRDLLAALKIHAKGSYKGLTTPEINSMTRAAITKLMAGKIAPESAIMHAISQAYHSLTKVNGYVTLVYSREGMVFTEKGMAAAGLDPSDAAPEDTPS